MSAELPVLILGGITGFYISWNMGAHDAVNSMASAVGTKAVTLRQAILIAGMGNMIGATFIGTHVTDTIRKGIVSPGFPGDPHLAILGAFAALLSAALWLTFAAWKSLPVSTTHSIVGAMTGFGIAAGGFQAVQWGGLAVIVLGWVIFPAISLAISFFTFKLIAGRILSRTESFRDALKLSPFFISVMVFVCAMSFWLSAPSGKAAHFSNAIPLFSSLIISVAFGFAARHAIIRWVKPGPDNNAESVFHRLQIGASCCIALAQGANDAANVAGPLAVIYFLFKTGTLGMTVPTPVFLLLFGGMGMACGIALGGAKGIQSAGEKIAALRNTGGVGVAVDFSAAATVLFASSLGLPVSTAHTCIGGVMGVGLAGGLEAVNIRIVFRTIRYGALTLPAAALMCIAIFKILAFLIN